MDDLVSSLPGFECDVVEFSARYAGITLRAYQREVALAIVDSVLNHKGLTFTVIFPRQSGKNEVQAQIEAYLLACLREQETEIVKFSPTWRPQSLNAMRRLERVLNANRWLCEQWTKEQGYIYRVDRARIFFLSAEPSANVVGATASTLLECDEAQSVRIAKWDRDINPMAASTNATRVFWGTAWTSQTLLARERIAGQEAEQRDGIRRVFRLTADEVRRENAAYGRFVDGEIAKLGRSHAFIRSQYFSEEVDELAGLFTAERLALERGQHPPCLAPLPGRVYAFCIDVGGGDVSGAQVSGSSVTPDTPTRDTHDSTVLTIFEVDLSTLEDDGLRAPTFRTVHRRKWTGVPTAALYPELRALAELWNPRRIVIDATGLGEGLASFLAKACSGGAGPQPSGVVVPFKFSQSSKSDLGWKFIGIVDSGRYKEHVSGASVSRVTLDGIPDTWYVTLDTLQQEFYLQARLLHCELLPGPRKTLRYSVPDEARDPLTGRPVHDDLVISAMLCAALPDDPWGRAVSAIIPPPDPLEDLRF